MKPLRPLLNRTPRAKSLLRQTIGLPRLSALCLSALFVCASALCRAGQTAPPLPSPAATQSTPRLDPSITVTTPIVAGCVLRVVVTGEPALSQEYEVNADGAIEFQLADDEGKHREQWSVTVRQKTADEARDLITASLKKYLRVPDVHVAIIQMPRLHIEMAGSGCKPGPLLLPLSARLSDALTACKPNADMEHILILRRVSATSVASDTPGAKAQTAPTPPPSGTAASDTATPRTHTLTINFLAFQQGESADDPALQDGDRIFIQARPEGQPAQPLRTVRVVGEVGREADLPLTPDMTLKDALARVGGVKETADPNKIRLHRGESGRDYDLKLPAIQADDPANNLKLMAGDYIMVSKTDLSMRWGISGEVATPSVTPFRPAERITVTSAIARAGGLTKAADRRKGVLRKGFLIDPTKARDIVFDYDAILKKTQRDWAVEPGDVIIVQPRRKRPTIWQQLLPIALRFLPLPF